MYGNEPTAAAHTALDARPRSMTERLRDEKKNLETRLEEVNNVLEQLEKSPETQQVFDAVARLGHFGY